MWNDIIKALYDKPTVNITLTGAKINQTRMPPLITSIQQSPASPSPGNQAGKTSPGPENLLVTGWGGGRGPDLEHSKSDLWLVVEAQNFHQQ